MCFYIGTEDLVANALIEILHYTENNKRVIAYEELQKYGTAVVSTLFNKDIKANLLLSSERTSAMLDNYSDFFKQVDGDTGICLRDEKRVEDLEDTFRGYLALDVLMAFTNQKCVKQLVS